MEIKKTKILETEKDLKDTLENEIKNRQRENHKETIKDIKYVGTPTRIQQGDSIKGKQQEDLFMVEIEIEEQGDKGETKTRTVENYYLGTKCIGGNLQGKPFEYTEEYTNQMDQNFDKTKAIQKLIDGVQNGEIDLDENSLNNLQNEEMAEAFSAYLGERITKEDVDKLMKEMESKDGKGKELKDTIEEKEKGPELSEEQSEKLRDIHGIQEIDLGEKVDGKESIGKRLMGENCLYSKLMVVYSENAGDITGEKDYKRNNTKYTIIGIPQPGSKEKAKVLDEEFTMDTNSGVSESKQQTKLIADGTATRDNKDLSLYVNKITGTRIGFENENYNINAFYYPGRTREENENVGIEVKTTEKGRIPIETREILNRNRGNRNVDNVQDEVENYIKEGCIPKAPKDKDGNPDTGTHSHPETSPERPLYTDMIPNTETTWEELASSLGYRGDGAIERTYEKFVEEQHKNSGKTNQEIIDSMIKEIENEFGHGSRETHNQGQ